MSKTLIKYKCLATEPRAPSRYRITQKGLWYHHCHHHLPPTPNQHQRSPFPTPESTPLPHSLTILHNLGQHIRIPHLPSKRLSPLPHALDPHRGSPHPPCQRPTRVLLARGSRRNGAVARGGPGGGPGGHLHGYDAAKGPGARAVHAPHQADVVLAGHGARAGLGGGDGGGQGEVGFCAGLGREV